MAVRLNEDKEMVKTIRDGLKRTGGYCPCRLERSEENKCICKEFRDQIAEAAGIIEVLISLVVLVGPYVLFMKKYYHLHEEYLASLKR